MHQRDVSTELQHSVNYSQYIGLELVYRAYNLYIEPVISTYAYNK